MRHYASVYALCESNYTCFTGTEVLEQLGKLEYSKSCAGKHEVNPNTLGP